MFNKRTTKELKKETKEIEKKIATLKVEKRAIENKGCFSDHELNEREKKIIAINNQMRHLDNEKKHIMQSIVNIKNKRWLKKKA